MANHFQAKILLGLFFLLAYAYAVHILYQGHKHPGNWTHNLRHYPYGQAAVVVFLLPQFGLLLLASYVLRGNSEIIFLSIIGFFIIASTIVLLLDFVGKKRLFRNDR